MSLPAGFHEARDRALEAASAVLARGARLAGAGRVVAVDPLTNPSSTDPEPTLDEPALEEFRDNLARTGVEREVELHPASSSDLAAEWDRPLRLLWSDGDHTCPGTLADLEGFRPHLSPGAVVAIHDVLNRFEGSLRVFMEEVLLSDDFGPAGMCGSIGWACMESPRGGPGATGGAGSRSAADPAARDCRHSRLALYERLAPLVRYGLDGTAAPTGLDRLRSKGRRWRVPHGEVDARGWARMVPAAPGAGRSQVSGKAGT